MGFVDAKVVQGPTLDLRGGEIRADSRVDIQEVGKALTVREKVTRWLSAKIDQTIVTKAYSLMPVERAQNFLLKPLGRPNDELMLRAFGDNPWMRVKFQRVCSALAMLEVNIFEKKQDGGLIPLLETYPMYQIIRRPNPLMFGYDFRFLTELYVRVAGACFWRPIFDGLGVMRQMWLYPAHWVIIIRNPRTWEIVYYDVRQPNGYVERLGPHELLWLRTPDPLNPYFKGLGEATALATEVDTFELASESDRRFFENDATPKGALVVPGSPTPDELKRMKDDWKSKMGSPENYGETAILSGGIDYKMFRQGRREMDFVEGQKYLRDVILAGAHPHIMGIAENVNRANADAAAYSFGKWEITPRVAWWEDMYNTMLAPYFHESIVVQIDNPIPEDNDYELKKAQSAIMASGSTRNEFRAALGYELLPPEVGDVILVPVNMQQMPVGPLTEPGDVGSSTLPHPDRPGGRPGDVIDTSVGQPTRRPGQQAPPNTGGTGGGGAGAGGAQGGTPGGVPELTPISPTGPAGVAAPTLASVNNRIITKDKMADILAGFGEVSTKELAKKIAEAYLEAISERSGDAEDEVGAVGIGFDVDSPVAIEWAKENAADLIKGIDDTTRDAVRDVISDGLESGADMRDISANIAEVFDGAKGWRAETIARTEIMRASNWAAARTYEESGVEQKEWLLAGDYDPTQDSGECDEYDGEIVDADDDFHGGVDAPPLHPNCRCAVAPVLKGEEEAGGEEEPNGEEKVFKRSLYKTVSVRKAQIAKIGNLHESTERTMRSRIIRLFQLQQNAVLRRARRV